MKSVWKFIIFQPGRISQQLHSLHFLQAFITEKMINFFNFIDIEGLVVSEEKKPVVKIFCDETYEVKPHSFFFYFSL